MPRDVSGRHYVEFYESLVDEGRARNPTGKRYRCQGRNSLDHPSCFCFANLTLSLSTVCQFSIDDLKAMQTSPWDGVRNHEAKNIMKIKMKLGDKVLFYHSNCKVPGVYGIAKVVKEGYPDRESRSRSRLLYARNYRPTSGSWRYR